MSAGATSGGNKRLAVVGSYGKRSPAAAALALAALVLALTGVWQSATLFRLDLAFNSAETELSFWGRGNYQPTEATRQHISQALDALLAAAPSHPDYLALAAYHDAWQAYREDDPALARPYALRAMKTQYLAQQRRPAYRQGWVKLVEYARRAGPGNEDALALGRLARQRLEALDPPPSTAPESGGAVRQERGKNA
jgi:hypothetical protein